MNKRGFFDQLHIQLANKYHTTALSILICRRYGIHWKFTPAEAIRRLSERLKLPRAKRNLSTYERFDAIDFMKTLSLDEWKDISQKTIYDK